MIRLALAMAMVVAIGGAGWWLWPRPAPVVTADGVKVEVPSGQEVRYVDTIQQVPGEGLVYRFRFLAPGIARKGGAVSEEVAQADMQWLCDNFALGRLPEIGPRPNQIVISMSDRPVKFGAASPEATQFFEGFRVENGACQWELF